MGGGGFPGALSDLHETTQYKVEGKGGISEPWYPQRGLRKGCPTFPILLNIYHQVVMDAAEKRRKDAAAEVGGEAGIPRHHVPGGGIPGRFLGKHNFEALVNHFTASLFADDTTLLGEE